MQIEPVRENTVLISDIVLFALAVEDFTNLEFYDKNKNNYKIDYINIKIIIWNLFPLKCPGTYNSIFSSQWMF